MVPGMPASAAQLTQPAAASSVLPYNGQSISYAQLLSGQMQDMGPLASMQQQMAAMGSMGGAMPAGGATTVLVQPRPHSPHGLSVSRSWAGLGGGLGAGAGMARQSPLRGSVIGQMQRPVRPWQH